MQTDVTVSPRHKQKVFVWIRSNVVLWAWLASLRNVPCHLQHDPKFKIAATTDKQPSGKKKSEGK